MTIDWSDLLITDDISKGSFGVVKRAEYLGTDVAVKEFLDLKDVPGFDLQKYIGRELEILSSSRHPNVVQFMGTSTYENKVYLVTEFVSGGNLKKLLMDPSKRCSWRMRVSFAIDIARALVYLHAHHFIHRDLKSENLLLTENHRLKLCDFGLSREIARTVEERRRLSFCGTDGYMAPEIILAMDFNEQVDVFSFGVILCEIITWTVAEEEKFKREVPYFGVDPATVEADPGCPSALREIALSCTESAPEKRPPLIEVLQKLRKLEVDLAKEEPVHIGLATGPTSDSGLKRSESGISVDSIDAGDRDSPHSSEFGEVMCERSYKITLGTFLVGRSRSRSHTASQTDIHTNKVGSTVFSANYTTSFLGSAHPSDEHLDSQASPQPITTGSSPIRRIGHFVPHRFSLVSTPTFTKCEGCHKRIGLGKRHLQCDECTTVFHKSCAGNAPPTCGLPPDLRNSLAILEPQSASGSHNRQWTGGSAGSGVKGSREKVVVVS
ncbi:kinase-like domain-containing protein [Phlyctochytrium arcticum]|nr:kinase-like domain-containing protein [Phlyctochytrium arcticum]